MSAATLPGTTPFHPLKAVRSGLGQVVGFFAENRMFTTGVLLLLGLLLFGLIGVQLVNQKGADMGAVPLNQAPSTAHLLGTDGLGREHVHGDGERHSQHLQNRLPGRHGGRPHWHAHRPGRELLPGLDGYFFSSFADVMLVIPALAILITISAYVRVVTVEITALIVGLLAWPLPARVIALLTPPPGCMFHPRCPQAMQRCSVDVPSGGGKPA
jgi:hypothetical protein